MRGATTDRPSLPAAVGMHCSLLSLASGAVGLTVALVMWWKTNVREITRIAEQASLFSAAVGLLLASIGLASQRKRVRRVAIVALLVNIAIVSFTLDNIFTFVRW